MIKESLDSFISGQRKSGLFHQESKKVCLFHQWLSLTHQLSIFFHSFISGETVVTLSSVVKKRYSFFHQQSKRVFILSSVVKKVFILSSAVKESFTLSSAVKESVHSFISSQRKSSFFHQWSKKSSFFHHGQRKFHSFISGQRKSSFFHQRSKKVFILSSAVKESRSRWSIFATSSCRQRQRSSGRRRWRGRGKCWTLCTRESTVCRRQLFCTPHEFVLHWDRPQEFDWQSGEIQDHFITSSEKLKRG